MFFSQHTTHWIKGEIFEAGLFGLVGILWIVISFLFWKLGDTPNARAMVLPLLIVGLILAGNGLFGVQSNQKRLLEFQSAHAQNEAAFIQSEKQRVEGFQSLYTMTKYIALGAFAFTLVVFFFSKNHYLMAIGIAFSILGLTGLIIDFFSKERADMYYEAILKSLH